MGEQRRKNEEQSNDGNKKHTKITQGKFLVNTLKEQENNKRKKMKKRDVKKEAKEKWIGKKNQIKPPSYRSWLPPRKSM